MLASSSVCSYREAAQLFRQGGADENTPSYIEALKGSAQAHKATDVLHAAGQDLEKAAGLVAKDHKQSEDAVVLYRDAGDCYRANGSHIKAAQVFVTAAEIAAVNDWPTAFACLDSACKVYEEARQAGLSEATFVKCINCCVKHDRLSEAITLLKRANAAFESQMDTFETTIYRNYIQILVLHFAREHYETAVEEYAAWQSDRRFANSEEGSVADDLMQAYHQGSSDALHECLQRPPFKYLNSEVVRMARKLKFNDAALQQALAGGHPDTDVDLC